jgi:hypothetical protein
MAAAAARDLFIKSFITDIISVRRRSREMFRQSQERKWSCWTDRQLRDLLLIHKYTGRVVRTSPPSLRAGSSRDCPPSVEGMRE